MGSPLSPLMFLVVLIIGEIRVFICLEEWANDGLKMIIFLLQPIDLRRDKLANHLFTFFLLCCDKLMNHLFNFFFASSQRAPSS